ncbi:MAG TPA: SRPBCC family protein [Anaerolineaceae bacterium]|nr:SRPBCC family protein [Anaerolineaceae bacterium]
MNKLSSWLLGAGIGAGLMYFLDPNQGDRRQSMVRDQVNQYMRKTDETLEKGARDLRNRTRGMLSEVTSRLNEPESSSDWVLAEHVRSKIGTVTHTASSIHVDVHDGAIVLTGSALQDEVEGMLKEISNLPGVRGVENNLDVYGTISDIPNYQPMPAGIERPSASQSNWTPSTRLLAGIGAIPLLLAGRRGGLIGTAFSLAGAGLAFRAVTNLEITRALGFTEEKEAIHVNKGINIFAPIEEVYDYWSNFENFPRFMEHVKEIHKTGEGHSHWIVQGPANVPVEFDAVTTRDEPNDIIAWETVPGSEITHRGRVRFREAADGSTQINVNLWYTPPAGVVGHAIASIFGVDPKQGMDSDLARLKSLLEEGKTTAKGHEFQA